MIDFCSRNKNILITTVLICASISLVYALLAQKRWRASQTMLLRDDLLGQSFKPGRFPSQESLKNAQETLLHIAKKSSVIREALRQTYPDKAESEAWPPATLVDQTRELVSLLAPNGSDFGKTDVVVLSVYQATPESAKLFAERLSEQIEVHLRMFRMDVLRSMERELQLQYNQARTEFEAVAAPVRELVDAAGIDLESLRSFKDSQGSFELQRVIENIKTEKRRFQTELQTCEKQLQLLREARANPQRSFVRNNELVQHQPALRKLTDGLNEAKLAYNTLAGTLLPDHPRVKGAQQAIENLELQIASEIELIEESLRTQMELAKSQVEFFQNEEAKYERRMLSINERRVDFQQLTNDLSQRLEALSKLQTNLSEIQSLASTADKVSLVSIVGPPELATKPKGTSRALLVLLGILGGGLLGLGIAFLNDDPQWGPALRSVSAAFKNQLNKLAYGPLDKQSTRAAQSSEPAKRPSRAFGSGTVRPATRPAEIAKWSDKTAIEVDPSPEKSTANSSEATTSLALEAQPQFQEIPTHASDDLPDPSTWRFTPPDETAASGDSHANEPLLPHEEDRLLEYTMKVFTDLAHQARQSSNVKYSDNGVDNWDSGSPSGAHSKTSKKSQASTADSGLGTGKESGMSEKQRELQDRLDRLTHSIKRQPHES